ncbi:MAG: hypothetical protein US60_C0015G0036 [Microgenomates group bacterium GW2011_GWC1_37_8]|uniref:dolichyl-phosphate beta-glucosyltransferase n=1 Tax=Candidatus Woesebacteria bacterium GW2011_GWB1_38_8 TaxID=1618570 RepID=A0A0G0P9S5_9BACT|nr:MAG: hypothetical protein US60_C0015G0036 [Microgenomates group bacterium GW2011_GWC1_37_8]KKQ86076.1 MAG: hypothetical protein UT08_C0002G0098 [Candidatus Woesebacteria bacterium GW2011_GWB1_38_8]
MKIKHMNNIDLSVVVPVFNEEKRIKNLKEIDKFLQSQPFVSELIVVNDGSLDKTMDILKKLSIKTQLVIISYKQNRGKGHAVKMGMLKARGLYHLFMDVDLSTSPHEIPKFIQAIEKGQDVVIGSRKIRGAKVINHQSFIRELLGRSFIALSSLILGLSVSDFTCGFKMFTKDASRKVFGLQKLSRWGFDSEILFIANKKNLRIIELPVEWKNSRLSKVKFPKDLIGSFLELLQIRINYYKGNYK